MGRSFGGYAALQTAIRLKEKVAGVISIYGPANISELLASMPTEWSGTAESIAQRVGDWRTATGRDFLLSSSPCSYVEHIDCPVLLIHGEQDRRVPLSQSRDLAQQLLELKKHVACIEVAEMGHGLNDFWSWEGTYQAVTGFLAMQISGKKMGEEFLPKDNRFRFGAISVPPS